MWWVKRRDVMGYVYCLYSFVLWSIDIDDQHINILELWVVQSIDQYVF